LGELNTGVTETQMILDCRISFEGLPISAFLLTVPSTFCVSCECISSSENIYSRQHQICESGGDHCSSGNVLLGYRSGILSVMMNEG
jgi:hypothetical protein